jgi:hypothetical protein
MRVVPLFCMAVAALSILCENRNSSSGDAANPFAPLQQPVAHEMATQLQVEAFKMVSTDTAGWVQRPFESSLRIVSGDDLYTVINGGATTYIDSGYQTFLRQEMIGPESQLLTTTIIDFGTAPKAAAFFNYKCIEVGADTRIPGFDSTVAYGSLSIGGITVFFHHENIYAQLEFSEFPNTAAITQIARSFMDLLYKKAGITTTGIRVHR